MYYWLSAYLTIYYTDTEGISAGAVSVMMLVIRFFDAINDPCIGSLADRTKSRWGRFRPWYMLGSIAMAVFIVLVFSAPVNASLAKSRKECGQDDDRVLLWMKGRLRELGP